MLFLDDEEEGRVYRSTKRMRTGPPEIGSHERFKKDKSLQRCRWIYSS